MGTRVVGVLAAALAVITGGIAGGAVAVTVFAPAAVAEAPLADAPGDSRPPAERTVSGVVVRSVPQSGTPSGTLTAEPSPEPTATTSPSASPVAAAPAMAAATCPEPLASGTTPGALGITSAGGVAGTTSADLRSFALAYNAQRVAHCLEPVPLANFRYDPCMEQRLFWMAEDPSTDPLSAWGHIGSVRSDGVPSVGCDGNLAGGYNNVGETFARKWWDSTGHRISLYNPDYSGSMTSVCIFFAVSHGGVPDEPSVFARAAARWGDCSDRVPSSRISPRVDPITD
ncbi:MAG: hypothetical protein AB7K08_04035 [Microbacteriaceae bacterium]